MQRNNFNMFRNIYNIKLDLCCPGGTNLSLKSEAAIYHKDFYVFTHICYSLKVTLLFWMSDINYSATAPSFIICTVNECILCMDKKIVSLCFLGASYSEICLLLQCIHFYLLGFLSAVTHITSLNHRQFSSKHSMQRILYTQSLISVCLHQDNSHPLLYPFLLVCTQDCWGDSRQHCLDIQVLADHNYIPKWQFHCNSIGSNMCMTTNISSSACVWTGW
jgi:hypothetical protein